MLKKILLSGILLNSLYGVSLQKIWESQNKMTTAESVILDQKTNLLYVANINGKPTAVDGNGFISILDTKGVIKKLKFIVGLDAPKGMAILNNRLFVSDINKLRVINLSNGVIEKTYTIDGSIFLNDVVVSNDGTIYVSDFSGANNRVYKIEEGEIIEWLDSKQLQGQRPNGLWIEDGILVVGTKSGTIFKYDMQTKERLIYQTNIGVNGIDGILPFKDGGYISSDWAGRIFINDGKKSIQISDTTKSKINAADIWYDKNSDMVYIPTFFDNRVMAYKVMQ